MVFAKFPHPLIEYPKASRDSPKDSHQAPEELAIIVPNPAHCIHSSDVMWSNSISPEPYRSVPRPIRIAHVGAGTAGLITAYNASYELGT